MIISKRDNILNNLEFLTEDLIYSDINNIPIIENRLLFSDLIDFAECNDSISLQEHIQTLEKANNINFNDITIVFDEADAILDPTILCLFENFVIKPISENSEIYKEMDNIILGESSLANWIYDRLHGDENKELDSLRNKLADKAEELDDAIKNHNNTYAKPGADMDLAAKSKQKINKLMEKQKERYGRYKDLFHGKINTINKYDDRMNKVATGTAVLGVAGGIGFAANKYLKYRKEKNASKISKAIAALRQKYRGIISQAQKNPKKAGMFKRVAAKILKVIDVLMKRLQEITK